MAKRRKTKRQKVISDSRHFVETARLEESQNTLSQNSQEPSHTYSLATVTPVKTTNTQIISVSDYDYLLKDIRKIALVTALIILTELGIFWTSNGF